jgi:aromatic ring-cleaving dioxygenase
VTAIRGYHAHIYYTARSKPEAARLREMLDRDFAVLLGRWHDAPIGPHTAAMYQVAFDEAQFASIVPWLMLNRDVLSVLVHPLTGDDYADHAQHALWLGEPLALRLDVLRASDDTR